jgi:hypothetical protein
MLGFVPDTGRDALTDRSNPNIDKPRNIWSTGPGPTSPEDTMQTDIRDAAHKLIDHLPTQATWDDLIYDVIAVMHIRQLLPDDLNRLR